jgi:hypothetical protein
MGACGLTSRVLLKGDADEIDDANLFGANQMRLDAPARLRVSCNA